MSGGTFNYIQSRYEFDDAINRIYDEINDGQWQPDTIQQFKEGIFAIKKARIYLQRIDWLLAWDDGEETFHQRLNDELAKINL